MMPQGLPINTAPALTMHIDLNSCFATIEAQANRLLRDRPVGVAAYDTPRGFVLAANYAAKAHGVKLGVNVQEARKLAPGIVIMTPDPAKYRDAHKRFKDLLLEYTDDVHPKSIDEFVLNFKGSDALRRKLTMQEVGADIKARIYERLGEAVTVNVGIAPNRFLAKYAAGFNKPNGLTLIDHSNLKSFYESMDLVDLPGINVRFRRRLYMAGITNPMEFLAADAKLLQRQVFKSITGYYWYLRLRGYEIDTAESKRGSIGHQYALPIKTSDLNELRRLLRKLCEKIGRKLRRNGLYAEGIHLYLAFVNYQDPNLPGSFENMHKFRSWKQGTKVGYRLYSSEDIYEAANALLSRAVLADKVKLMAVTTYRLKPWDPEQLDIFSQDRMLQAGRRISDAMDIVNDRYGEFVVTPATMMDMQGTVLDRIAFGAVKDM